MSPLKSYILLCCNPSYLAVHRTDEAWAVYPKLVVIFTIVHNAKYYVGMVYNKPDQATGS